MKLDDNMLIVISDDGPGINESEMPHIFERFYKGKKGKYGLGLAIAKAVVDAHKGSIRAYNKPVVTDNEVKEHTGAVFEITLPLPPSVKLLQENSKAVKMKKQNMSKAKNINSDKDK